MEKICPKCLESGVCRFKNEAELIASEVKIKDNSSEQLTEALRAHILIADGRVRAEEIFCRHSDKINPDYHGKKLL